MFLRRGNILENVFFFKGFLVFGIRKCIIFNLKIKGGIDSLLLGIYFLEMCESKKLLGRNILLINSLILRLVKSIRVFVGFLNLNVIGKICLIKGR